MFRKSVYDDLFSRIDLANQHLEKLIDRSSQLVRPANERETSFTRLKQVRRLAHSLHNIIVNGQYWKCTHPDEHVICFPLGSHSLHQSKGKTDSPTSFQFPVMISCWNPMTHCGTRMYREDSPPQWHHVDIESKFVGSSTLRGSSASTARISDICDALSNTRIGNSNQKSLGYIKEGDFEHTMRLRKMVDPSESWRKSLANLLESSNSIVEAERDGSYFFSKHDRLRLAVKLAYGVLELHGSWIQTQWKASDIIFLEPPSSRTSNPFVEWDIGHKITRSNMCQEGLNTALVRSKVLFPLALVLVELSLGQNLDSLRTPEDEDQQEASSAFKTAFRLLRYVGLESGPQYMNVVERCLFWNGAEVTSSSLEIEDTQGEAFHQILLPLFDNLNSWEDSLSRSV